MPIYSYKIESYLPDENVNISLFVTNLYAELNIV